MITWRSFGIPTAALLLLAGLAMSQRVALADVPTTVTLTLTGVNGASLGGVYTNPYEFQIGTNSSTVWLVCDDFTTETWVDDSWPAQMFSLGDVTGNAKFQATTSVTFPTDYSDLGSYTPQQEYDAAAALAELLLPQPPSNTYVGVANAELISFAIWQIFYPKAIDGWGGQGLTEGQVSSVNTYMQEAFAGDFPLTYPVYIYTPDPTNESQEFIGLVSAPEGSTIALTVFDLLAVFAVLVLWRRRMLRRA
jgi:hypothetical protein